MQSACTWFTKMSRWPRCCYSQTYKANPAYQQSAPSNSQVRRGPAGPLESASSLLQAQDIAHKMFGLYGKKERQVCHNRGEMRADLSTPASHTLWRSMMPGKAGTLSAPCACTPVN